MAAARADSAENVTVRGRIRPERCGPDRCRSTHISAAQRPQGCNAYPSRVNATPELDAVSPAETRRILVIDDDATVSEIVGRYLSAAGFSVAIAPDGQSGLRQAELLRPDLVILDRMLPVLDGIEVCRRIKDGWAIPVIMLTALDQEHDRIDGLEAGADDYLAKPFSPRELVLRVQSVLRRSAPPSVAAGPVVVGAFSVNVAAHEVLMHGERLPLTAREFDLLAYLVAHPHQALSREQLLKSVWGWDFGDLSTVTVHVRRLREKIEVDSTTPRLLKTVWGVGYRFDPEPATALSTDQRSTGTLR